MVKRFLILIALFVIVFSTIAPALAQPPQAVASVNTGNLNVRTGPGLQYGAIATLPQGFGVQLLARNAQASWVFIGLTNGVNGWVNVNYLYTTFRIWDLPVNDVAVAAPLTPTGSNTRAVNLNVRSRPDPVSSIVAVIGLGQQFDLLGRSYDALWAQIRLPNGVIGWVNTEFINTTVPVRSVSPTDGSVYAPPPPTNTQSTYRTHLVVAGDTLAKIGQRYGVNLYVIAAANNIVNINRILIGQRLIIP